MPDPVFIVGHIHSGTTLLQNAVGRHAAVFNMGGESKFFEYLPMVREQYADLDSVSGIAGLVDFCVELARRGYALTPEAQAERPSGMLSDRERADIIAGLTTRDHIHVFAAVMDHLARRACKAVWLEKTPSHVHFVEQILAAMPNTRFVEIVRDPRDVLASKKTRRATVWTTKRYADHQRGWKHLEKAYDPLWDALSWKTAVKAGAAASAKHPECILRIRYEDLVQAPESVLARVCRFLGLDFEPAQLDVPAGVPADDSTFAGRGRGVATDSVGRWRATLSDSELALIQAVTSADLVSLGYAVEAQSALTSLQAVPLLAYSAGELFVRLRHRQQMGGNQFLKLTLGIYLRRAARLL